MSEPAKKEAVYEDLYDLPENMTGEIIDGELIVTPRPAPKHVYTTSVLDKKIGSPYQFGESGGPGGWIILVEPEIKFAEECNPIVPDLAGWKAERFPKAIETNWISVAPDWVCEMLSPRTRKYDRMKKMPKYARFEVQYAWLIDPSNRTLEVFQLRQGEWVVTGFYEEDDKVRAEPFTEIEIDLSSLWLEKRVTT